MKLLLSLSLFMIKNMSHNDISFITKINSNGDKLSHDLEHHENANLGNDERNEKYFTNDAHEMAKIARNIDILDKMNKLKKIHDVHHEMENMKKINIKPGNMKSGLENM